MKIPHTNALDPVALFLLPSGCLEGAKALMSQDFPIQVESPQQMSYNSVSNTLGEIADLTVLVWNPVKATSFIRLIHLNETMKERKKNN